MAEYSCILYQLHYQFHLNVTSQSLHPLSRCHSNNIDNIAQLTFSSAEKHGLLRIYPLLESGLSYAEIQDLVRTKHLTNIGLLDIANAKLVLGYDKAWLAGNNKLNQLSTPIPPIPAHVRLEEITVTFDVGYLFKHNFLIGVGANICDAQLLNATNAKVTRENITQMLNHFSRAGYKVVAYSADSGSEFAQDLNRTLALCGITPRPSVWGRTRRNGGKNDTIA